MTSPDRLFEILRESLEEGEPVEIEGLGTFQPMQGGGCNFTPQVQPQVFVAYASEDLALARRLCEGLRREACSPWLDKDKLLPGQVWPRAIARAIEISDAFVACFSPRSILKRGQFQCELRWALDCARRMPLDQVFVIPVRLEPCVVPHRVAEQLQYIDLFPEWDRAVKQIAGSIHRGTRRPSAGLSATS